MPGEWESRTLTPSPSPGTAQRAGSGELIGRLMSVAEIEFEEGELMPIGVETLCAATALPFDLYLPGFYKRSVDVQPKVVTGLKVAYAGNPPSQAPTPDIEEKVIALQAISL